MSDKPKKPDGPSKDAKGKKKGPNIVLLLIPVALVAALVLAFALPPTHAMLAKGPLKPLLARFDKNPSGKAVAATTPDPAADVKRLNDALATSKQSAAAKDAQIAQLQSQVTELQVKPTSTPTVKATPAPVSEGVKRAATYWAGMDADKAAEIVKALPDAYVKTVFSQMPADAVSDIMSALPAKAAARLTAGDDATSASP